MERDPKTESSETTQRCTANTKQTVYTDIKYECATTQMILTQKRPPTIFFVIYINTRTFFESLRVPHLTTAHNQTFACLLCICLTLCTHTKVRKLSASARARLLVVVNTYFMDKFIYLVCKCACACYV